MLNSTASEFHGYPVDQSRIVSATYGQTVNLPAHGRQIAAATNRPWQDDRGRTFASHCEVLCDSGGYVARPDAAGQAAQELAQGDPLIIGAAGHAMVLTAMSYARKAFKAIETDFKTVFLPYAEFEKLIPEGNYFDKNDPAIFGVELMNEGCPSTTATYNSWITTMAAYFKTVDTNHLVGIGNEGFLNGTCGQNASQEWGIANVDFGTWHIYPVYHTSNDPNAVDPLITQHCDLGVTVNKPVLLKEFGWSESHPDQGTTYTRWTDDIYNYNNAGKGCAGWLPKAEPGGLTIEKIAAGTQAQWMRRRFPRASSSVGTHEGCHDGESRRPGPVFRNDP